MKTLLILHKKSCMRPEVKEAVKAVNRSKIDLQVRIPWNRSDIRECLKQARKDGVKRVIAGGGDGTVNKVVNALMRRKNPQDFVLGVMPLGTANDFARGGGIPLDDLPAALELACTAEARPVDVGRMNGDYFINVASGGFGAEVTATTPVGLKKTLGGAAYTLMGLVKLVQLTPYSGRITYPDGQSETGEMLVMAVGNSRYAGGAFDVAPLADVADGLLDLAVLSPWPQKDTPRAVKELAAPLDPDNRYLRYRQLSSFVIESDQPLHINLDGEPVTDTRFRFETVPGALRMALG